jgi:hypothetical protein
MHEIDVVIGLLSSAHTLIRTRDASENEDPAMDVPPALLPPRLGVTSYRGGRSVSVFRRCSRVGVGPYGMVPEPGAKAGMQGGGFRHVHRAIRPHPRSGDE